MASLCRNQKITIDNNNLSPAPILRKLRKILSPCNILLPVKFLFPIYGIKRLSLLRLQGKTIKASMTVETALVLPLFCFFMVHMGSAIEMIRLHGNLEVALWNAGRQIGIYGGMLEDADDEDRNDRPGAVILSYTYIKKQITDQLGEEYLRQAPLEKGPEGLQFLESKISGDIYEIVVTYKISPLIPSTAFREFRMANRYYGHLWNGYEIPGAEDDGEYVYVTENASVYHTDRECTHIRLAVRPVEITGIPDGYGPCEKCVQGKEYFSKNDLIYYVCKEGERYHSRLDCSGLKRTVYRIKRGESGGYRECSRCKETERDRR